MIFIRSRGTRHSFNRIRSIFNSSFTIYQRITKLTISSNDMREIATDSFYTMPMLQYLDLSNNWFRSITSNIFKFSINLSHLNLAGTNIKTVPSDILRWIPNLQLLDITSTTILHINITSCSSKTRKLNLIFYKSKIKAFVPNKFRIDCEINSLSYRPLSDTSITSIDPQTIAAIRARILSFPNDRLMRPDLWDSFFRGIGMSDIEDLLLHKAKIGEIDQHHFALLKTNRSRFSMFLIITFPILLKWDFRFTPSFYPYSRQVWYQKKI